MRQPPARASAADCVVVVFVCNTMCAAHRQWQTVALSLTEGVFGDDWLLLGSGGLLMYW